MERIIGTEDSVFLTKKGMFCGPLPLIQPQLFHLHNIPFPPSNVFPASNVMCMLYFLLRLLWGIIHAGFVFNLVRIDQVCK